MSNTHSLTGAIFDNIALVRAACDDLHHLARAAHTLGLAGVAEGIYTATAGLEASANDIRIAHSQELDEQIKHSQRTTFGLLQLAVSGAIRTPEERQAAIDRGEVVLDP